MACDTGESAPYQRRTMLNYPPVPTLPVGLFTLRTWGVFVTCGILVATWLAGRRAFSLGISNTEIWNGSFWTVLGGVVGARLLYVIEYGRDFIHEPWRALAVWEGGLSAYGAIVLGACTAFWYVRHRSLSFQAIATAAALPALLGDAIGRLGGAASHMYPGRPTEFPLSFILDGVQRHEVGIELSLVSFFGFLCISGLERAVRGSRARHVSPATVLLWYSLERFFLDFLRASDLPKSDLRYGYAGLTLAQYFACAGFLLGLWLLVRLPGTKEPVTSVLH